MEFLHKVTSDHYLRKFYVADVNIGEIAKETLQSNSCAADLSKLERTVEEADNEVKFLVTQRREEYISRIGDVTKHFDEIRLVEKTVSKMHSSTVTCRTEITKLSTNMRRSIVAARKIHETSEILRSVRRFHHLSRLFDQYLSVSSQVETKSGTLTLNIHLISFISKPS